MPLDGDCPSATASSKSDVRIIPVCVTLPSPSSSLADTGVGGGDHSAFTVGGNGVRGEEDQFGVVGTITLRGESAVVWLGWGSIESTSGDAHVVGPRDDSLVDIINVGCGRPPMGSLALSMPPSRNNINNEIPTSQLIGGSSEEDMMLGHQISSRLAKRVGCPVFVSCSFSGWVGDAGGSGNQSGGSFGGVGGVGGGANTLDSPVMASGFDDDLSQRMAALAERAVLNVLQDEKKKRSTK